MCRPIITKGAHFMLYGSFLFSTCLDKPRVSHTFVSFSCRGHYFQREEPRVAAEVNTRKFISAPPIHLHDVVQKHLWLFPLFWYVACTTLKCFQGMFINPWNHTLFQSETSLFNKFNFAVVKWPQVKFPTPIYSRNKGCMYSCLVCSILNDAFPVI
jgi:hypothetical protein